MSPLISFLYSIDRNEPTKQLKAQQLLQQLRSAAEPTLLLWQVIGELVQQLRRWRDQGKLTVVEFGQHVHVFRYLFPLMLPTPAVLNHALDFASRFSLAHWDSMLLGSARVKYPSTSRARRRRQRPHADPAWLDDGELPRPIASCLQRRDHQGCKRRRRIRPQAEKDDAARCR
jgi:predicted nucleic acid-binding protein